MNIIKTKVIGDTITPIDKGYVIENQVNQYAIEFEFDETWDFEEKYVIFQDEFEEQTFKRAIINNQVIVPSELLNGRITIQVYGQNIENNAISQRQPSLKYVFSILNSLPTNASEEQSTPTPTQWELYIEQIENMCNDLQDQFDDLKEDCEKKCDDVIARVEQAEHDIQANANDIGDLQTRATTDEGLIQANSTEITNIKRDYSLITETGNKLNLSINSQTYVMTLSLLDKNNNVLSTQSIDFPIESAIVNASYNNSTKVITFTLQNGTSIQVPIGDIISGLASQSDLEALANRVSTIENDYLTSTDKTELQGAIGDAKLEVEGEITDLQTAIEDEQEIQDGYIRVLQNENERLSRIVEGLPTKNASGTNFLLTDMVKANIKEYELKGDTSQNGTPTPSDPIPVEVVTGNQEINVFGKNYFNKSNPDVKNIYIDSTNSKIGNLANARSIIVPCRPNTDYTVSKIVTPKFIVGLTDVIPENNVTCLNIIRDDTATQLTITGNASAKYLIVFLTNSYDSSTWQNILNSIQIEEGTTKTSYEEYSGYTKTISLGNIELCKIGNYQDRIYKSNDKWYLHKETGKYIITENTPIESSGVTTGFNTMRVLMTDILSNNKAINSSANIKCNRFTGNVMWSRDEEGIYVDQNNAVYRINTSTIGGNTREDLLSWLMANNIILYYILETATDTEITDTSLISQLEAIYDIILNTNNTIITTGELPTIIDITGYVDIMSLISTQDSRSVQEETRKGGDNSIEPIEEPIETKEEER